MAETGRAAVWRRLAAAAVDGVFFVLAASLISVALYGLSDGRLRAYVFQPTERCAAVSSVSPGAARAALAAIPGQASRIVSATACRRLFLGLESGRYVSVTLEVQQGETVMGAAVLQPVDRSGEPVQPLSFGWAYPLVFVVSMAIGEGLLGGTPGKAALGLRVARAGGGRLGVRRALARNAILYAWLLVGAALVLGTHGAVQAAPDLLKLAGEIYLLQVGLVGGLALAILGLLVTGRPDPVYDRWASARVVPA